LQLRSLERRKCVYSTCRRYLAANLDSFCWNFGSTRESPSLERHCSPLTHLMTKWIRDSPCPRRGGYNDISFLFGASPCNRQRGYFGHFMRKSWLFGAQKNLIFLHAAETLRLSYFGGRRDAYIPNDPSDEILERGRERARGSVPWGRVGTSDALAIHRDTRGSAGNARSRY